MLLPCAAAVLIMVVAFQLRRIEQDRTVKSTILTLASCVSPVNVVLPSRLVAYIAALGPIAAFLPVTDIATLQSRNLDFGLLPIMMFFLAIAVVLVLCCLAWGAVVMFGSLVHKAVVRAAGGVAPTEVVADVAVSTLQRFPTVSLTSTWWPLANSQKRCSYYLLRLRFSLCSLWQSLRLPVDPSLSVSDVSPFSCASSKCTLTFSVWMWIFVCAP